MANARNGSKPARSSLEEQPYLGRAELFALPVRGSSGQIWSRLIACGRRDPTNAKKRFCHRLLLPVGMVCVTYLPLIRPFFHSHALFCPPVTRSPFVLFLHVTH